jgi:D-lactate dehydrogenase
MPVKRMSYSHFGCNVVHEDMAFEQGVDTHEAKMELKWVVDHVCKGKLPAEHGHGLEYHAPKDTQQRWQNMDPLNVMNPGVGDLSSNYRYRA